MMSINLGLELFLRVQQYQHPPEAGVTPLCHSELSASAPQVWRTGSGGGDGVPDGSVPAVSAVRNWMSLALTACMHVNQSIASARCSITTGPVADVIPLQPRPIMCPLRRLHGQRWLLTAQPLSGAICSSPSYRSHGYNGLLPPGAGSCVALTQFSTVSAGASASSAFSLLLYVLIGVLPCRQGIKAVVAERPPPHCTTVSSRVTAAPAVPPPITGRPRGRDF